MSILFRVEALELHTDKERHDRRTFRKGLNLLIGDPGAGKSTLIELIRFGLGMKAQQTPVVERSVERVTVEIVAGDHRLGLARAVRTPGIVEVVDLDSQEALGEYPVVPDQDEIGIGTALLRWLGVPSDIEVTVNGRRKVVTFEHVWEYMHVPQFEIDHSIARHDVTSLTPRRKRIFELLFGLVDERLTTLEAKVDETKGKRRDAGAHLQGVQALVERAALPEQHDLMNELSEAEQHRQRLLRTDERLRSSLGARDDRIVALRGLLTATRNTVARTDEALQRLEQTQQQRRTRSEELAAALARLDRVRTANVLLAPIEFSQCPRCLQELDEHRAEPEACRLCLQDIPQQEPHRPRRTPHERSGGPDRLPLAVPGEATAQETQLSDQSEEIRLLLIQGEQERATLQSYRSDLLEELRELEAELDLLTSRLGFPGSEELARVAEQLAGATAEVERINLLLSTAEHAASFATAYEVAVEAWTDAKEELSRHQEYLESTSSTLFSSLTEIYSALLLDSFTAPNVREALIYSRDFLPYIDGKKFDTVSISGGNRVPFIVGYWLALQSVALSSPQYPFPGFLILDSPQKSLGPLQELSTKMYRQIQAMAAEREETFQIFVLDTDLPRDFTPSREPIQLTYRNPGIRSIRHPGPGAVHTVEGEPVEEPGIE
ncbi:AAA family ATPase [Nocardiopsis changdeensis]|uniref:AAA family ATPase n=1 Tax=Nocardiopsis changdeensis TaxID=2831969 RepID=A0ABX8BFE6_9ACTN|nr:MULTISPECIES: ATP-binding protein [Nocardiopsis]QUX20972.1 AAA family ATPase [Nocardiopsis changdeensis]QYX36903.1 AAA family ATPase [Nocardiopsis sp. MT53]